MESEGEGSSWQDYSSIIAQDTGCSSDERFSNRLLQSTQPHFRNLILSQTWFPKTKDRQYLYTQLTALLFTGR